MKFAHAPALLGCVGARPLPGCHAYAGEPVAEIREAAVRDAVAMAEGGLDGIILQDIGNLPVPRRARPETVAMMTALGLAIREAVSLPLGVSLLEEDPSAALAIARAIGAGFVRIKVYVGAMVGAEGIAEGGALEALEARRRLGDPLIELWADVHDRTRVPLGEMSLEEAAWDAVWFGKADGLIVTGRTVEQSLEWIRRVRARTGARIWIGGSVSPENVREVAPEVDGIIVATSLKVGHDLLRPVDPQAVRRLVTALRAV